MSVLKNDKPKGKKGKADFTVNKDLNRYREMDLFKDKVDKANHILKTVGLPKEW